MPAHNGWVLEAVGELLWNVRDKFPDFCHRLRMEVSAGDGGAYVYFRRTSPPAVLKHITPQFFARYNMRFLAWTPVFRRFGSDSWEAFHETRTDHQALGGVDFGWRYRESVLPSPIASAPDQEEGASKIVSHFPGPVADASPDMPAFLRKIMD